MLSLPGPDAKPFGKLAYTSQWDVVEKRAAALGKKLRARGFERVDTKHARRWAGIELLEDLSLTDEVGCRGG